MQGNLSLPTRARPPLGIATLASCAGAIGFILSLAGINIGLSELELVDLFLFLGGVLMLLAGIDFYRQRTWTWWFAVAVISVLAAWFCSVAVTILAHRHEVKSGSVESALLFLALYPFLLYYLVRSRTRVRFGIGSKLPE